MVLICTKNKIYINKKKRIKNTTLRKCDCFFKAIILIKNNI